MRASLLFISLEFFAVACWIFPWEVPKDSVLRHAIGLEYFLPPQAIVALGIYLWLLTLKRH